MLEAVIPISDREKVRRNLERMKMSLNSLSFFWKGAEPLLIHIVVPDEEEEYISSCVHAYSDFRGLKINLMLESNVSPIVGSILPTLGILKQMLIKLSAFSFVNADYCLILDSDVVACKPFSTGELIQKGRVLTEWLMPSTHAWWLQSARVLGYELEPGALSQPRMFVTPQILCRPILSRLLEHLQNGLGIEWMPRLIAEYSGQHPDIWTEYTLYDLFAERCGLRPFYHMGQDEMSPRRLHNMSQSIWLPSHFDTWNPSVAIAEETPGYFLVLQSITAHSLDFDLVKGRWHDALVTKYPSYPI